MDGIITAINDFFRGILFGFAQCFLFIFDVVWECVKRIVTLDLSSNLYQWFLLIMTFVVMFLLFRISKIFVKTMFDEDYRMRLNIGQLLIKIMLASFAIGFTPIAFSYISTTTTDLIGHIEYFIPSEGSNINELKPSTILLQAGRIDTSDINADLSPEIDVSADNFDINAKDENNKYIYFSSYTSLFLLIVESIAGCFIFVLIALMIGERLFAIAYKYILAPYPISGLVDHEDKSFSTWMKMLIGDFIMNFAQVYGVFLTIFLCNNASIQQALGNDVIGICAKIIFFLAGLLAVLNLPSVIATIIGGHSAGAIQSLQELKTMTTMTGTIAGGVAGATVGIGMGAVGGMIGGASENYAQATGETGQADSKAGAFKSSVAGGVAGMASTAKTHFGGGRVGGGLSAGASILGSGVVSARNAFSKGRHGSQSGGGINSDSPYSSMDNDNSQSSTSNPQSPFFSFQSGNDGGSSLDDDMQINRTGDSGIINGEQDSIMQDNNFDNESIQDDAIRRSDSSYQEGSNGDTSAEQGQMDDFYGDYFSSPRTIDHIDSKGGEKIYTDTARRRLNQKSNTTLLNGEPLKDDKKLK